MPKRAKERQPPSQPSPHSSNPTRVIQAASTAEAHRCARLRDVFFRELMTREDLVRQWRHTLEEAGLWAKLLDVRQAVVSCAQMLGFPDYYHALCAVGPDAIEARLDAVRAAQPDLAACRRFERVVTGGMRRRLHFLETREKAINEAVLERALTIVRTRSGNPGPGWWI